MAKGGYRANAGRKKGSKATHTLEVEAAKKILIQRLHENLDPILKKAVDQAKKGDRYARDWLSSYAWGKPTQPVSGEGGKPIEVSVIYLPKRDDQKELSSLSQRVSDIPVKNSTG